MGTFRVGFEIGDLAGSRWEALEALVDTGATYTRVPRGVLARLSVRPSARWEFETADGRVIERDVAQTSVRLNGQAHVTFVVFGDEGSPALLGAYTLEGFRMAADPVDRRLIPVRGLAL
ncbi:MAG: retroviral-like aspartic protease family protein [Chloroflexi bacterium]|nr:retroviral-like aspartic protease family protein [Chloroflexota bacterium]